MGDRNSQPRGHSQACLALPQCDRGDNSGLANPVPAHGLFSAVVCPPRSDLTRPPCSRGRVAWPPARSIGGGVAKQTLNRRSGPAAYRTRPAAKAHPLHCSEDVPKSRGNRRTLQGASGVLRPKAIHHRLCYEIWARVNGSEIILMAGPLCRGKLSSSQPFACHNLWAFAQLEVEGCSIDRSCRSASR